MYYNIVITCNFSLVISTGFENEKCIYEDVYCSWGVIIPKSLLEVLKINPVLDKIDFEIEGETLKITKVKQD